MKQKNLGREAKESPASTGGGGCQESYVRQGVPASLYSADAAKEHDKKEGKASASTDASEERATSLVSMTKSDKKRLTAIAKTHGLSLSAFFRLAADEYIANHDW